MSRKHLWILLVLGPGLGVLLIVTHLYYGIAHWSYDGPDKFFEVKPGEGFSSINYRLNVEGLIYNPKIFHKYSQYKGILKKFKTGEYRIPSGSTMDDVIAILTSGKSLGIRVTIPEGKNLFEIAKILEEKGLVKYDEFVALAKNSEHTKSLNIPAERVEGYLYPDTYLFPKSMDAKSIIRNMVSVFRDKTKDLDFSKTNLTPHEVIILASIVEKETGAAFERPIIAGVYKNRLDKPMRLYADPTTIYGIYENFDGNLRKHHLQQKTPYNTYRIDGLPKGPIANPGLASIRAAITPQKHDYYYFVSQNDGTHVFTKNYKEHLKAVKKWQLNRKNRQGKSWRDLQEKSN